jgi:hypothetical protein
MVGNAILGMEQIEGAEPIEVLNAAMLMCLRVVKGILEVDPSLTETARKASEVLLMECIDPTAKKC